MLAYKSLHVYIMPDPIQQWKSIGVVGAGSMGSMMTFAFAELGLDVSVWDVDGRNVDKVMNLIKTSKEQFKGTITGYKTIDEFVRSLDGGRRRLFMFSITHGKPADEVLGRIKKDLKKGDVILDGGNEYYRRTERRQEELRPLGVNWIGMGVSGGYQSARRGPSLSPGGDRQAIEQVLPLLELYAAKDKKSGKPCVTYIGPGGAGHYVKMCHNGIEGGMLSAICEAWVIMHQGLGMGYDEIGDAFTQWSKSGELRNTFLLDIGADICHRRKTARGVGRGEGVDPAGGYVLDDVLDKVVQDDDDTEGTPLWAIMETASRHVSAPTLAAAHYLRIASGNRNQRLRVTKKLDIHGCRPFQMRDKKTFIETLRRAVYAAILASYCQGLELIARASKQEKWDVDLGKCIQIWRAGCIIQSEAIADMLQPVLLQDVQIMNIKLIDEVSRDLHGSYEALKEVVLKCTEMDACVPALSASLEYIKYEGSTSLPTQFMEAEMDYFGAHAYWKAGQPGEDPGLVKKGPHHYEWKPA
ncbi:6-phosphogluconate dehydrogenase, decarboxylating [Talaromyces proteolyticus]|uniref:phosphogluconate dehydrogenase (NADP(+)-dependent, decarboxylating) n=1 Tax=Talaromyces proteolyticus TaxID=1131652 RepID=A0AAD4KHE2_9EURO|nr:6-phosphogluconate dehydrogenase, decarboxylating [Talaromyces proteolyticus]KAH8689484.1 6-phosphogluconate dehydrogenase, decarboxylating [Talaromyces proteolyticus]